MTSVKQTVEHRLSARRRIMRRLRGVYPCAYQRAAQRGNVGSRHTVGGTQKPLVRAECTGHIRPYVRHILNAAVKRAAHLLESDRRPLAQRYYRACVVRRDIAERRLRRARQLLRCGHRIAYQIEKALLEPSRPHDRNGIRHISASRRADSLAYLVRPFGDPRAVVYHLREGGVCHVLHHHCIGAVDVFLIRYHPAHGGCAVKTVFRRIPVEISDGIKAARRAHTAYHAFAR